ncbi:transposase [Liquorilactobacillus nagelii]|uniref:transposase n=1 Tax=Liquorilactobacillus nagelii TaxID=82688 RepID=UPI003C6D4C2C
MQISWQIIFVYCHRCSKSQFNLNSFCTYFENSYSLDERSTVKSIFIDLNVNYQLFIRRLFPNAEIIIDSFHVVQLINRAQSYNL